MQNLYNAFVLRGGIGPRMWLLVSARRRKVCQPLDFLFTGLNHQGNNARLGAKALEAIGNLGCTKRG
jgi:hypothetical protein